MRNVSGRFESRFVHVRVNPATPSVLLRAMADSVLGVWCSHGEGRALFPDASVSDAVSRQGLVPLRYCDDDGAATERYPMNPNGSPGGVASLCSADGRHTAMMPHPERSFLRWQLPHVPPALGRQMDAVADEAARAGCPTPSPWLNMFHAMREWLEE